MSIILPRVDENDTFRRFVEKINDTMGAVEDIDQNIDQNLETELSRIENEKATKAEVEVERQRINNIVSLPEGSTTGDAELIDIRVGADGKTYPSAGEAVRSQFKSLKDDLSNSMDYLVVTEDIMGTIYNKLFGNLPQNTIVYVNSAWGDDAPPISGTFWLITYSSGNSDIGTRFAMQEAFYIKDTNKQSYVRIKEYGDSWGNWENKIPDTVITNYGIIADDTDFNNLVIPDIYYCYTPNNFVNSPTTKAGWLFVVSNNLEDSQSIISQYFIEYSSVKLYTRHFQNEEWSNWITESDSMKFISITESSASSTYNRKMANLEGFKMAWVSPSWFDDTPNTGKLGWLFTLYHKEEHSDTIPAYGMQIYFVPETGGSYVRWVRSSSYWSDWVGSDGVGLFFKGFITNTSVLADGDLNSLVEMGLYYLPSPNTILNVPNGVVNPYYIWVFISGSVVTQFMENMNTGVHYVRYKVGDKDWTTWKSSDKHDNSAKYFAFGDSTTYGQIATVGGQSPYNYPACVGRMLNMVVTNKAIGGQGLLKDWDTIQQDYITDLDMTGAKLITVGWAYNDSSQYTTLNFGTYTDVDETTVIGKYFTIMKQFQQKCPDAQVILITGYGSTSVGNQFTAKYTFQDGQHTVKEFYDELEKMCNLHGWCCVNQSKGTWVNEFNWADMIGDNIHPKKETYLRYGNYMAGRISSFYGNVGAWTV